MAAKSVFDTLTITAEVDYKYGVILEASCTLATDHGRQYIHDLLKGISLREGPEEAEKSSRSIIKARPRTRLLRLLEIFISNTNCSNLKGVMHVQ